MKLKLAVLFFSQAASALEIDKTNYKHHLCDERIFTQVPGFVEIVPPHLEEALESNIKGDYQYYCHARDNYDEAIESKKTSTWRTHRPCGPNQKELIEPAACVERQGIYYAQACEKLKQDRDSMPNAWNAVVSKLVSCNNM